MVGVEEVVVVEVAVIIGLTASNSRSPKGFLHSIHRAIGTMDSSLNIEEGKETALHSSVINYILLHTFLSQFFL
jgi:hypothetical protein